MRRRFLATIIAIFAWTSLPGAQSLADVARTEEARRKAVKAVEKAPAKVYTNDDLRGVPSIAATPAAGGSAADADAAADADTDAEAADEAEPEATDDGTPRDEKFWRERITAARDALARNKVLADALQSRINALNADFVNTDDPAQREVVEANRATALAELDRMNKEIETQTRAIAGIEEEARKAGVPPGWLR